MTRHQAIPTPQSETLTRKEEVAPRGANRSGGRIVCLLVLVTVGVCVWLNSGAAFPGGDDMIYSYCLEPGLEATETTVLRPIATFGDIIRSQEVQYSEANGRLPVHILVQIFDGFHLEGLFDFLNAVVFCLTLVMMCRFVGFRRAQNVFLVTAFAFILLFLMPESGTLYYLPTLSINYLWVLLLSLAALEIWRIGSVWWFPVMLIAGWSHEAFSLPIAGAMVVWLILHPQQIKGRRGVLLLFYGLGALGLVCSPGNFLRLGEESGGGSVISALLHRVINSFKCGWLDVALLCGVGYMLRNGLKKTKAYFREVVLNEGFLLMIIAFSALFLFTLGGFGGRAGFSLGVFSLLLLARLNRGVIDKLDRKRIVLPLIALLFLSEGYVTLLNSRERERYDELISRYLKSEDGLVAISAPTDKGLWPWSRYVNRYEPTVRTDDAYYLRTARLTAHYYDHPFKKMLLPLPEAEIAALRSGDLAQWGDSDHDRSGANAQEKIVVVPGSAGANYSDSWDHIIRPVTDESDRSDTLQLRYDFTAPDKLPLALRLKMMAGRGVDTEMVEPLPVRVGDKEYELISFDRTMTVIEIKSLSTKKFY